MLFPVPFYLPELLDLQVMFPCLNCVVIIFLVFGKISFKAILVIFQI